MSSSTFTPHPAEVNSAKTVCKCGGADSVCGCAPDSCTCASCPKSSEPENKAVPVEGSNKTVCKCGGNEGTCVSYRSLSIDMKTDLSRLVQMANVLVAGVQRTIKST